MVHQSTSPVIGVLWSCIDHIAVCIQVELQAPAKQVKEWIPPSLAVDSGEKGLLSKLIN
jgi:hypothetical protein